MAKQETKPKIEVGFQVGKLTVAAPTEKRKNGYCIWRCTCACGGSIELDTRALQRGTYRDCGCETKVKPGQRDLTGQRFGKLVCLEPTEERRYKSPVWLCQCDCGNKVRVPVSQLTAGYVKSCGCLEHPPLKDFVGKRFGNLTVLSYAGKSAGMHRWRCKCDCGNETIVGQTLLQTGKTRSCGCLKQKKLKENLKLVDGTSVVLLEAGKNRLLSSNTSGYTGVYLQKRTGRWAAQITFQGKTCFLGSYTHIEDAIKARQRGEEETHDKFLEHYYQALDRSENLEKRGA